MKKIEFWKMSGSGNDFVLIDNRRGVLRGNRSAWARRVCYRQEGVGADGLLLLEPSRRADFRMVYYNADGSRASMCGNGARCMAYFARARGAAGKTLRFQTDAYPVQADVRRTGVRVMLADPKDWKPRVRARVGGRTYRLSSIDTGVPHALLFVPNVDRVDVAGLGRALRFHRVFGPRGANVNFVQTLGPNRLRVRTYERGVERETLACGTGVTAAAIAAALLGKARAPVRCVTAGGDALDVRFALRAGDPSRPARDVSLQGPVRVTFKGRLEGMMPQSRHSPRSLAGARRRHV